MTKTVGQTIVDLLAEHHLASAPQLQTYLAAEGKKVNKTSVYRALEKLQAENIVCKLNLVGNELLYELRNTHHDHLVCLKCGKVIASECQIKFAAPAGFTVDHHHLTIFGYCEDCA